MNRKQHCDVGRRYRRRRFEKKSFGVGLVGSFSENGGGVVW